MADSYGGNRSTPAGTDAGKIFVGGLSWQTTEESLRWHFEQYGTVSSVELMKDRNTGKPRGFGFVSFADAATVDLVMESQHEVNHKIVDVKRAQARGVAPPSIHRAPPIAGAAPPHAATAATAPQQPQPMAKSELTPEQLNNKVFVGGLPPTVDNEQLEQVFSQFGPVTDAIVMLDQTSMRSRGFGFVTFENGSQGAQKAVEAQPVPIQGRHVEVKLATPREGQPNARLNTSRPPPSKFLGLRAGQASSGSGEFAGLAVAYGRNGWKAGYGSKAFGKAGWAVSGWDDGGEAPERSGFSFAMLRRGHGRGEPPRKRSRH